MKVYYGKPFILEYWFEGRLIAKEKVIWTGKPIVNKPLLDRELYPLIKEKP